MRFRLRFSPEARERLLALAADSARSKKYRRVQKALAPLEANPRHPGLQTHVYHEMSGPGGEQAWQAYVENNTPGAWRIWFCYGPEQREITVITLGPHPD